MIRLTSPFDKRVFMAPAAISGLGIQRDDGRTPVFAVGGADPFVVSMETVEQITMLLVAWDHRHRFPKPPTSFPDDYFPIYVFWNVTEARPEVVFEKLL